MDSNDSKTEPAVGFDTTADEEVLGFSMEGDDEVSEGELPQAGEHACVIKKCVSVPWKSTGHQGLIFDLETTEWVDGEGCKAEVTAFVTYRSAPGTSKASRAFVDAAKGRQNIMPLVKAFAPDAKGTLSDDRLASMMMGKRVIGTLSIGSKAGVPVVSCTHLRPVE